jgi:hypothetical protein
MPTITVGFLATLTKDGAQDITLLVQSFYLGRPSPCVTIEDGVNLGLTGGHPDPLELTFQIAVDRHPGYTVQRRTTIEMETPDIDHELTTEDLIESAHADAAADDAG